MTDRMRVFDRRLVRRRRERVARGFAGAGFLVEEVADRLLDRLGDVRRAFPRVLLLGAPRGLLESALVGRVGAELLVAADGAPGMLAPGTVVTGLPSLTTVLTAGPAWACVL